MARGKDERMVRDMEKNETETGEWYRDRRTVLK